MPNEKKYKDMDDPINKPPHYCAGDIETLDYITAWEMSFSEGNVIKYVTRAPYKGKELSDLKKAEFYIKRLIKKAEDRESKEGLVDLQRLGQEYDKGPTDTERLDEIREAERKAGGMIRVDDPLRLYPTSS